MAEREHTRQITEEAKSVDTGAVPDEEGVTDADAAEELDQSAEEQPNRPDQEDFSEGERQQYDDPPVESEGPYDVPIADADHPEDR